VCVYIVRPTHIYVIYKMYWCVFVYAIGNLFVCIYRQTNMSNLMYWLEYISGRAASSICVYISSDQYVLPDVLARIYHRL